MPRKQAATTRDTPTADVAPVRLVADEARIVRPEAAGEGMPGDPNYMLSLARGLMVMRAFTEREPNLSIADVARITGLPRAVARRCLYTLMQLGYAGFDGRTYFLRPKVLALGYAYLSSASLGSALQPYLERVSAATGESCSVGVLEEDEVVYVARASARRIMTLALNVGSRVPAYCSAMGRVLLAHRPEDELAAFLDRVQLVPLTEHTLTSRAALQEALERVRRQGFALVDQELELGLRSIAVPVRDLSGRVVAAMNISTQAGRIGRRVMQRDFLRLLEGAAQEVSLLLAQRTG